MDKTLSVLQLNTYIKRLLERDFVLKKVRIEGELSNFKHHGSGHIYFTLKDDEAQVSCVQFRSRVKGHEYELRDGDKVIVEGSVSLYEKTGQYQIYVSSMKKAGIGELYIQFEALKKSLQAEGLFDESKKKPIPKFAKTIGIITSDTGAAIRDIVQVAKRRNNTVQLILYPSLVQGSMAKHDIVSGIRYFNEHPVDVMIVGRGGGSIEDLWPFNEEIVARAMAASTIPIISAVGHETDFTIADFVSDLRAPTPSAASELAVFDRYDQFHGLHLLEQQLRQRMDHKLHLMEQRLEHLTKQLYGLHPASQIELRGKEIKELKRRLHQLMHQRLDEKRYRLSLLGERIEGYSPLRPLESGYAYIQSERGVVKGTQDVQSGDTLDIVLKDGVLVTEVKEVQSNG